MNNTKKELLSYLDNVVIFLIGLTLLVYPLLFTLITTDAFALPKQIFMIATVSLSVIILGIRMIIEGKIRLKTTPFDLPLFLFIASLILSAFFAVNRFDSIVSIVPIIFSVLLYFVIVNAVRNQKAVLFIIGGLVLGTTAATVLSLLAFFNINLLPFAATHAKTFTPFGSLIDQALFLGLTIPIAGYAAWPVISPLLGKKGGKSAFKATPVTIVFSIAAAVMLVGLGVTVYMLATSEQPLILPFAVGFQTAFAAISQDAGRVLQGFLFGSGFGTYLTDFTRFKPATYNANPQLWSFTFFRSSSYILELLATTGVLGVASFVFLIYRVVKEKSFFLPLMLALAVSFLLPFSYLIQALLFVLLGIFAALRSFQEPEKYSDLEFYFVALKHGLIVAQPEGERAPHDRVSTRYGQILPISVVVILLLLIGYVGFLTSRYVLSDVTFQRSLVAAESNNGTQTYNLQREAISQFPYRDTYYRIFSQTNLALANSLAAAQPKNSSPSAEVQQQISQLIQQSINSGRTSVTLSPQSALNWNNLSSIYRSLIGFGENAEQFAVLTNQQAIQLDPNNPQQYVNLGGIYYQLGQWEEAQRQFQVAINLKPDYANAYYNLGHALENKGDLQNALAAYQAVQQLSQDDKQSLEQIKKEIAAIQEKIKSGQTGQQQAQGENEQANNASGSDLNVNQPEAKLPERPENEKAELPAPPVTPSPTPTGTQGQTTPTPSPAR